MHQCLGFATSSHSSSPFLLVSSEHRQRLLNQERKQLRRTELLLFSLCPEGLAEQRHFSSCIGGGYKAVCLLCLSPPFPQPAGWSFSCCHRTEHFPRSWKSAASLAGTQAQLFSLGSPTQGLCRIPRHRDECIPL